MVLMSEWKRIAKGEIWVLEQQTQPNGKVYEVAKRTPGVRLIVVNDKNEMLLNKEKRHELEGSFDLRLPGGKVFDDIDAWLEVYGDDDALLAKAKEAVVSEAHEECGVVVEVKDLKFLKKDINGGKGEWDLYYFCISQFSLDENGPAFHGTEADEIDGWEWFSPLDAEELALDVQNGMSESRSARYVASWAKGRLGV